MRNTPSNPKAEKKGSMGGFVVSFSKQELRALEKHQDAQGALMPRVPIKLYFDSGGRLAVVEGPGYISERSWAILIAAAKYEAKKSGAWAGIETEE